jgi:transcription antitermination factor NusG
MWGVVYCQPQKEHIAQAELTAQGFEVWLPRHNGRPAAPPYLFVRLTEGCRWRSINGTRGVNHLISEGDAPKTVSQAALDTFREALEELAQPEPEQAYTHLQPLRIETGPFQGFTAQYLGSTKGRIALLLDLLRGKVVISATKGQVAPLGSGLR